MDKAITDTEYYLTPKPLREFKRFVLESTIINYLKAYSCRYGIV